MLGLSLKNMKTKKKTGGNLKTLCSLSEQCKTSNYKNMLGLSLKNMKTKKKTGGNLKTLTITNSARSSMNRQTNQKQNP